MTVSLWTLVQTYCDETGSTEAWVMRRAGLNKGTFTAWRARGMPCLPTHSQILGLSEALRVDYSTVLEAILHDAEYLPKLASMQRSVRDLREEADGWRQADLVLRQVQDAVGDNRQQAVDWVRASDNPKLVRDRVTAYLLGRGVPPMDNVVALESAVLTARERLAREHPHDVGNQAVADAHAVYRDALDARRAELGSDDPSHGDGGVAEGKEAR